MRITIDGKVQPQGRPRFRVIGRNVSTYDPPKSKAYKKKVAESAKQQTIKKFNEPIEIKIVVYKYIPRSWSRLEQSKAAAGQIGAVTRPDLDNYVKCILDGLNGVAFNDDSLICRIIAEKKYSFDERAEIEIKPYKGEMKK